MKREYGGCMGANYPASIWDWGAGGANAPHMSRYLLARGFVFPWETVLDAACGWGYGSGAISLGAKKVIGVDVNAYCVQEAKNIDNVEYRTLDLNTEELPDVDAAISIETMEHLTPEGLKHFVSQLQKHVKRCIVVTVPLGGTSQDYVNEEPGPNTEKNDFFSYADIQNLIASEGSGWKLHMDFTFGYSYFGIFYKEQPKIPQEWKDKGYGI